MAAATADPMGGRRTVVGASGRVLEGRGNRAALSCRRLPRASIAILKTSPAFDITRKRRKSFPSETHVKRGAQFVRGDVELSEKLGRNDLCPCGSGARFQALLPELGAVRRRRAGRLLSGSEAGAHEG